MKKIFLLVLAFGITVRPGRADIWDIEGVVGVNYSETAVSKDWAGEEVNSRIWSVNGDGQASRNGYKTEWVNSLELEYGKTSLTGETDNITSNLIFFDSIYTYKTGTTVNPYLSFNTDTQFKDFFDPVTYTESGGVGWQIVDEDAQTLNIRLGGALKQTFSSDAATLKEQGMESVIDYNLKINEYARLTSELKLFTEVDHDIYSRWNTSLYSKIGDFLTARLNYLFINRGDTRDSNFFRYPQRRLIFGLGFSYNIF